MQTGRDYTNDHSINFTTNYLGIWLGIYDCLQHDMYLQLKGSVAMFNPHTAAIPAQKYLESFSFLRSAFVSTIKDEKQQIMNAL